MSQLKVNALVSYSGNTVTLGTSGDTINVASGVTFNTASATVTLPTTIKVDTIQNTNSTNLITQTNVTTITFGATSQTISVPSVASFATTIGVGGATPAASGAGITFPASVSASSNANTLDDYEEGTWTPTAWGTGNISSASGRYIKIGKQVYISWKVTYGSTASGDTAGFQNTPFAPFNSESATGCTTIANTDYGSAFTARVIENGSRVIFYTFANGGLTNANFSTKFVIGGAVYEVA
jgi:hypothetical protein